MRTPCDCPAGVRDAVDRCMYHDEAWKTGRPVKFPAGASGLLGGLVGGALGSLAPKHLRLDGLKWKVQAVSFQAAELQEALSKTRGYLYAIVPDLGPGGVGFYIVTYELPPAPTLGEVMAKTAEKEP